MLSLLSSLTTPEGAFALFFPQHVPRTALLATAAAEKIAAAADKPNVHATTRSSRKKKRGAVSTAAEAVDAAPHFQTVASLIPPPTAAFRAALLLTAAVVLSLLGLLVFGHLPPLGLTCALLWAGYSAAGAFVYARYLVHALQRQDPSSIASCSLGSLAWLYAQCVLAFAALYLSLLYHADDGRPAFVGLRKDDGLENVVHAIYFSAAVFTTAGFGDCYAVSWAARACVVVQLCVSAVLHVLVFSRALDVVVSKKISQPIVTAASAVTGSGHTHRD